MQEDIITAPPAFKLYTDRAIAIGAFVGGPLVAGYLAAENFKQLGQKNKARNSWIIAIVATIVIFGALLLVPQVQNVPRYVIPICYTAIAQFMAQKYQRESLKKHLAAGGRLYSNWRAVWIGLIGLLILVALLFGMLTLTSADTLSTSN